MGKLFDAPAQEQTQSKNPWDPAIPHLETILSEMGNWYNSAKDQGYISSTGDLSGIYGDYLNAMQGIQGSVSSGVNNALGQAGSAMGGAQDIYQQLASGQLQITPENINEIAGQFVDNDLLNSQIEAATRDDVRNFTENVMPNIDRNAATGGNVGSSRTGVAQGIAQRGTEERISDTAASMRGQAYGNALNQAMGLASGNVQQQLAGAGGLQGMGNQWMGMAGSLPGIMMGQYNPMLQGAQLGAMIQGQQQADKIGNRDYLAQLLGQYANIAGGIGGMGGTTTGTVSGGGGSMFDKLLGAGSMAGGLMTGMGGLGWKPFG